MLKYQKKITELVKEQFPVSDVILTIPPDSKLGDIALPCFQLAKELKRSPAEIASRLKDKFSSVNFIDKIEISGVT
ncbi:MAG: argS [Clostridiales bacterium]|jgi:arginyl-tRNA synthetase|nr:argS [Clostridiales bacterium]